MPAAIPAIVGMIGAVAGAGASIYSAKKQSSAAVETAKMQTDAAAAAAKLQADADAKSLDFLKQQWAYDQAQMAPYYQIGSGAASKLSDFMGIPVSGWTAPKMPDFGATDTPATAATPAAGGSGGWNVPSTAASTAPTSSDTTLRKIGELSGNTSLGMNTSDAETPGTDSGQQPGSVWMVAPTGEVKLVSPDQVEMFKMSGARVLSGGAPSAGAVPAPAGQGVYQSTYGT